MSSITGNDDNDQQFVGGSGEMISTKKEYTSCEQNDVDNITDGINNVTVLDDTSVCANCGKEGSSEEMNTCNKCKMVKYCNAACKKKHRSKHKKACERRVAELYDEKSFKEIELEECPICFLILPIDAHQTTFQNCCGKVICNGCIYAMHMSEGKDLCAFCRTPTPSSDLEIIKRIKKLMKADNGGAFHMLAQDYANGTTGLPQDFQKANELYLKAGELGYATGYFNLACSFDNGTGVEVDEEKNKHYLELAANGHIKSRYNLGCIEENAGDHRRAYKHYAIAARAGMKESLDEVKQGFMNGDVTKDEYANTLRAYHGRQKEMKSDTRDKAAAAQSQG